MPAKRKYVSHVASSHFYFFHFCFVLFSTTVLYQVNVLRAHPRHQLQVTGSEEGSPNPFTGTYRGMFCLQNENTCRTWLLFQLWILLFIYMTYRSPMHVKFWCWYPSAHLHCNPLISFCVKRENMYSIQDYCFCQYQECKIFTLHKQYNV